MLHTKLKTKQARAAIIGLGYVGLPLAMVLVDAGFSVYGIDTSAERVETLRNGRSYILDVSDDEVAQAVARQRFAPTSEYGVLADSDVVVICVPTPLRKTKDPDMSYVVDAVRMIEPFLHADMLIVLESTTYPGTTEELVASVVQAQGYTVGKDVYVCFSPERVDPGNARFGVRNTPKVLGGVTPTCTEMGLAFYGQAVEKTVGVSSVRVAEMVKLLENTFRAVNIGLVNELALMSERMGVNIWEVIGAASTKPFGFMPFYPGPGIGGHCIPLDPMYLAWKAQAYNFHTRFIALASDINAGMPRHVCAKVSETLNRSGKPLRGSRVLLLGMAYKPDVTDYRESPGLEVYRLLSSQGAAVDYHDPYVDQVVDHELDLRGVELSTESLRAYDCVVIITNHSGFDYQWIAENSTTVVDTRNAIKDASLPNVVRLGVGAHSGDTRTTQRGFEVGRTQQ